MHCPLCHHAMEDGEDLQLHYLLCPAYSVNRDQTSAEMEEEGVKKIRFRWAKVEPCVDHIIHLISSLAGSVALHWSGTENLYESALTNVPLGKHTCQLAVGGEIIPVDEIEVNESSDTIYIIPIEEDEEIPEEIEGEDQGEIIDDDDDPVVELLASTSISGADGLGINQHNQSFKRDELLLDGKIPDQSHSVELSPLYKELLQHQVLHGEPSWIPHSGNQSPTTSDQELDELMRRTGADERPPYLTAQPANPEERKLKSPTPIRPMSNQEKPSQPETLPGTPGENAANRESETRDAKVPDNRHGNGRNSVTSSSSYSGSTSKRSSEHSSRRQSPEITSDVANDSDGSNALQEQSLDEAVHRESPEIQELPQPFDGTFLTRDLTQNGSFRSPTTHEERTRESPTGTASEHSEDVSLSLVNSGSRRENQTFSPIPLDFGSNQSSNRASPHDENQPNVLNQGDLVPGSGVSPRTPANSLNDLSSGGRGQYESINSLPYPGSLQGDPRLASCTEEHRSPPVSGHEPTPPAISPAGSQHSRIRKQSFEAVRSPSFSGLERSLSAPSPTGSSKLLNQQRQTPQDIHSPLGSVHSSTHSVRGQSPLISDGRHTGSFSSDSSLRSSARSTPRGSSPPSSGRRSLTDLHLSGNPMGREQDVPIVHSRESPTLSPGSRKSHSAPRTLIDLNRESRRAFSLDILGHQSPRSSVHSRGSPASLPSSREYYRPRPPSRSLIDSFDLSRNQRPEFSQGPAGNQRLLSSERHRDIGVTRSSPKNDVGHSIPSSASAFTPMNDDGIQLDVNHNEETEVRRREQELLSQESRDGMLYFEAEVRRLRAVNEELSQQLLSVETAAALSEQDNQKSRRLEFTVSSLRQTVTEKDEEIKKLKERCDELERVNQKMKDEQESLKTVNKLTYEDLNRVNSDLKAEISNMRRKTYGSPLRTNTSADEILNKTLREKVSQLESEKRELKQKYRKTKLELDQTKAEKNFSDLKLKKAKSEADLPEKFDKLTSYSKPTIDSYEGFTKTSSSGRGSTRYSYSDSCYDNAYKVGFSTTQDTTLTNESTTNLSDYQTYSSRRDHVMHNPLYNSSHQRRLRGSIDDDIDALSDTTDHDFGQRSTNAYERPRTLSSGSSTSSLLEYEYGSNMRIPYQPSTYSTRDTKVELREPGKVLRKNRPHSCDGDFRSTLDPQTANYSPSSLLDYRSPSRRVDYGSPSSPVDYRSSSRTVDYRSTAHPAGYRSSTFSTIKSSTSTTGSPKTPTSKPCCPKSPKDIELGMRVLVTRSCGNIGRGIVRYKGPLPERNGSYIGVELENESGKHDGTFQGIQLFKCKPKRGIFVKTDKVIMCYHS